MSQEQSSRLPDKADFPDNPDRENRVNRDNLVIGKAVEYLQRLSKTDQLRALLHDGPTSDKAAAATIYGTKEDWKKIADLRRDIKDDIERAGQEAGLSLWTLKIAAKEEAVRKYREYLAELDQARQVAEEEEARSTLPRRWNNYLTDERAEGALYVQAETLRQKTGSPMFTLDWLDLARTSPALAEQLEAEPQQQLDLVRALLKERTGHEYVVTLRGFRDRVKIARITTGDHGRLLNIHGEVVSKGDHFQRPSKITYECPSCGNLLTTLQTLDREYLTKPPICKCGRRGGFCKTSEEVVTAQALTVQEVAELLAPGERPRQLPALLLGVLAEEQAERLNLGAKVTLTGYYVRRPEGRKAAYNLLFVIVGAEEIDEDVLHAPTPEAIKTRLAALRKEKDPLGALAKVVYGRVQGHQLAKELLAAQLVGDFSMLLFGLPGIGKTELGKCSIEAHPRSDFIQASFASRAGITAAASKDEHTGRFVGQKNALASLHPGGLALVDELDKANDDLQHSLLSILQDRVIRLRKTDVQADIPADIKVVATANPAGDVFDPYKNLWEQADFRRALFDRFGFVVLFTNNLSALDTFRAFFTRRGEKRRGLDKETRLLVRELVRESQTISPDLEGEETLSTLDRFMRHIIVPHPEVYGQSYRVTEHLPALLEALCRFTLDNKPRDYHFEKAEALLRGIHKNHKEVLQ